MPAQFIAQTDPYFIPAGFTQTTTPQGGTAYRDPQGNLYTRTASGFQLAPPTLPGASPTITQTFGQTQASPAGGTQTFVSAAPPPQVFTAPGATQTVDQYKFQNDPAYNFAIRNPIVNVNGTYYKWDGTAYNPNLPITDQEKTTAAGRNDFGGNSSVPLGQPPKTPTGAPSLPQGTQPPQQGTQPPSGLPSQTGQQLQQGAQGLPPQGGYVSVNGAFFQQTPSGYAAVSDRNILSQLSSGQIQASPISLQQFAGQRTSPVVATSAEQRALGTPTPEEVSPEQGAFDNVTSAYGVSTDPQDFLLNPLGALKDLIAQVMSSLNLPDYTKELETLKSQYDDLTTKRIEEEQKINDNPWISEAQRSKEVLKVRGKYEDKEKALTDKIKLFGDAADDARNAAQFAATTAINLYKIQADNIQDIMKRAEDRLTVDIKEYQFAQKQGFTGSFTDFKNLTGTGKVTPGQIRDDERALQQIYVNSPLVKTYNEVLNKKLSIDSIIESGVGGPADLALVFEFMKALDPGSVVRDTEYATAAKSGNIFAGVFARFNGYLKESGGFLPEAVKSGFKELVNRKLQVASSQYTNFRSQIEAQATRQGLDPRNIVIDFSVGGNQGVAPSSADLNYIQSLGY